MRVLWYQDVTKSWCRVCYDHRAAEELDPLLLHEIFAVPCRTWVCAA